MNNPFQLTFELEQHTPLIHFQYDQAGAGLRATEVKPKLDRFIINKLGGADKVKIAKYPWVKEIDEKLTLDFKLKIKCLQPNNEITGKIERKYINHKGNELVDKFPCFFASLESPKEKENRENLYDANLKPSKYAFAYFEKIIVEILCLHQDLKKSLESYLSEFFFMHNFGTRQSKGFGSFTIKKSEGIATYQIPEKTRKFTVTIGKIPFDSSKNYFQNEKPSTLFIEQYKVFYCIQLFHSAIRSGINIDFGRDQLYFKSLLFMYFYYQENKHWDKREIKKNFFSSVLTNQQRKHSNPDILSLYKEAVLARDLLGLATESFWKGNEYDNDTISKVDANKLIERYKTPILYKPILANGSWRVYILPIVIHKKYLDNDFIISSKKNKKTTFKIKTPVSFSLHTYFSYIDTIDISAHLQIKNHGGKSQIGDVLIQLFNDFKELI